MKHLVIVGTGAFARELCGHARHSLGYGTDWDIKGFIDGDVYLPESEISKLSLPVLGDVHSYQIDQDDVFACAAAVDVPQARKKLVNIMLSQGAKFISIIHETALIQENTRLGEGIILCPFTSVNDHAVLGDYVLLNEMTIIGHDAQIGEYVCMMTHVDISGFVQVGQEAYFGSGARVLPHARIGTGAFVGAGSVVLRRVRDHVKVFGNPALPISDEQ